MSDAERTKEEILSIISALERERNQLDSLTDSEREAALARYDALLKNMETSLFEFEK